MGHGAAGEGVSKALQPCHTTTGHGAASKGVSKALPYPQHFSSDDPQRLVFSPQ